MNRNTIFGFLALFGLLMLYQYINSPSQAQLDEYKRQLDSLAKVNIEQRRQDSILVAKQNATLDSVRLDSSLTQAQRDSVLKAMALETQSSKYGEFGAAALGEEKTVVLESDKLKITFTNKGGRIRSVQVKGFEGYNHATTNDPHDKKPVELFAHPKSDFHYLVPIVKAARGSVSTADLFFEPTVEGKTVTFRAYSQDRSRYIEQKYSLTDGSYLVGYGLVFEGIEELMPRDRAFATLVWTSYLDRIEKNPGYERTMSSIHYKAPDQSPSYCNCAASVQEDQKTALQWVSHSQQFFNFSLIANPTQPFAGAQFETVMTTDDADHLKILRSTIALAPVQGKSSAQSMQIYLGPNDYNILSATNLGLERIIPFGWSIFGVINRYVIRPVFTTLSGFIPSYGLIIILLTFIIRVLIYPLQYKMLLSGVKMSLLRPEIEKMRKKYEGDQQSMQMEQMRMFQQYGVNPLGGCLPMLLTMPIWIALYRFFPASIEFRQKGFLWADDLASYDSVWDFGFNIPFYGDHFSLFTFLWMISMFIFVKYNASQMDMSAASANPGQMRMMMILQYAFPVIFFFALNSWASGLTVYMLFSNFLNILQTYVTKNFVINKEKVRAEMEENKKNPKASAWQQRYEDMMKQYQEQQKNKKK